MLRDLVIVASPSARLSSERSMSDVVETDLGVWGRIVVYLPTPRQRPVRELEEERCPLGPTQRPVAVYN